MVTPVQVLLLYAAALAAAPSPTPSYTPAPTPAAQVLPSYAVTKPLLSLLYDELIWVAGVCSVLKEARALQVISVAVIKASLSEFSVCPKLLQPLRCAVSCESLHMQQVTSDCYSHNGILVPWQHMSDIWRCAPVNAASGLPAVLRLLCLCACCLPAYTVLASVLITGDAV